MKRYLMILVILIFMISGTACGTETIENHEIVDEELEGVIEDGSYATASNEYIEIKPLSSLKEISPNQLMLDDLVYHQYFKITGEKIFGEDFKLDEYKRYIVDGEELFISTVLLEGQQLVPTMRDGKTLDHPLEDISFNLKIDDARLKDLLNKCIGYSEEFELYPNVYKLNYDTEKYQSEDLMMRYNFYPICYKVEYQGNEYRILKRQEVVENGITKIYADGIIDIQQFKN